MNSINHPVTELSENVYFLKLKICRLEQKVTEGEAVRESLAVSEAKYKTIIDNLIDIIFTHNIDGTVAYVTRSVEQYGYMVEEILGRNMLEFVHPDDHLLAAEVNRHLVESGGETTLVIKMLTNDGQTRVMEDHAKAVLNSDGKVIHIVGVLRDITEKKAAEEALENINTQLEKRVEQRTIELSKAYEDLKIEMQKRKKAQAAKVQSEQILSELVNFLPDPTFVTDAAGKVTVWNQAMEELTGIETGSILGKGDYEYAMPFYGTKRPMLIDYALCPTMQPDEQYLKFTEKGDTLIAETFAPLLKNAPTYLWAIAKRCYDSRGNILGAIESIRNVTHIKETEFKLNNELSKFRALYDLAVNMSAEKSLEDNLVFIVEKSRSLLNTDTAFIFLADDMRQHVHMHTFSGINTEAFKTLRVPIDQGLSGEIMKTTKGYIFDNHAKYQGFNYVLDNIINQEGIVSSMAVPIRAGEKSLGVLYVANRKDTAFSQDNLDTLLLFGNLAAVEIIRKQAQNDLRESETKYRTVFENTGSAMVIIEKDGTLSLVNEVFVRLTGFAKNEIEGRMKWSDFIVPEEISRLQEQRKKQRTAPSEAPKQYEFRLKSRNGKIRDIYVTLDMIPGTKKSVAALLNITNRKRAEQALQKAHTELENRVAERTHALTIVNTDLKELLQKQDVNIDLAKNILAMINSHPCRHTLLKNNVDIFFTAHYLPCYAEGGDHFFIKNFAERHPGIHKTTLSLKDQSGHEVSCILRSIITDLIHNALLVNTLDPPLEETIARLNKEICELSFFGEDNFFTAVNAEIDHETMSMRYVSAGHPPFLFIRNQDVLCLPSADGEGRHIPIGIQQSVDFASGSIQLQKGDKLIFFTDGLTEIPHMLGNPILNANDLKNMTVSIIREQPDMPVSLLMAKLFNRVNQQDGDRIVESRGFEDDITLIGLELEDNHYEYEDIVRPKNLDDFSCCVNDLFRKISSEWEKKGVSSPDTRLHIVLEEAMANAWRHGNCEDPNKSITIRRRYGNDAVLEVIDEGEGFAYETFYDPTMQANLLNENGRGNFIMRLLTEETQWKDGGRHLIACFSKEGKDDCASRPGTSFNLWRRFKKE